MNRFSKKLSSTDIAKLAGVSQATVSRVLSGGSGVKPATREKVMEIVRQKGYRPNVFAQGMRTNHSATVGVAVSRITNPIVPEILEELTRQFALHDRRVIVWNTDEQGEESLIRAVGSGLIDGLVCTAASHQITALQAAQNVGLPIVSINRAIDLVQCDQVVSTNEESAREVAHYLIRCGKTRLGFVNGPLDRTTLADREAGFRAVLDHAGHPLEDKFYYQQDFHKQAFRQFGMDIGSSDARPQAIACGNDLIAIQILNGLRAVGCRVPEDIWVVGFDGIEMSGWDIIDLTTVQQPVDLMAKEAADLLLEQISGTRMKPKVRRFRSELVIRGSTDNMGR
ncbi:MAG: LacI family DNA-binding transcriptional regulator [Pseudomonadota bacterium]